jgi:hypothetical protein
VTRVGEWRIDDFKAAAKDSAARLRTTNSTTIGKA